MLFLSVYFHPVCLFLSLSVDLVSEIKKTMQSFINSFITSSQTIIQVNSIIILIVFCVILFCSALLPSIVSGATQMS